jgi:NAD(P)-dependent dehydrogenase (short-subunit alcohol dehydrogenase family)
MRPNMTLDLSSLRGKSVLITGASKGIGAEAARAFARAGANVGVAARNAAALTALADEIGGLALTCDVSDFEQLEAAVAAMRAKFGALDILVNNAGVIDPIGDLATADPAEWGRLIDINVKGVFHGLRAALPGMIAAQAGTIISLGSGAAYNPLEGWGAYCTSKAGTLMLNAVAHIENRQHGVRIMSLSPGTVATDMQVAIRDSGINPVSQIQWSDHVPPAWPAIALTWMCTPDADEWVGREVKLRDDDIRVRIGLSV